jgi:putative aldouronate transport system permease protein
MIENGMRFSTLLKKLKAQKYLQIFIWLGLIWMFIFWFLPLIGVVAGFENYNIGLGYLRSKWVGLKYFIEMFRDSLLINSLRNTVVFSLLNLIVGFPLPIIFALALNELIGMRKYKRTIQTISYMPYFLSWAFVASFIITFFAGNGLFNQILSIFGIQTQYAYMANPTSFASVIVGSSIWKGYGISSIMYIAAMSTVNVELYDSAMVDGANRWQKIRFVTLPGIKSTIIVLLILSISSLVNSNFEQFFLLSNSMVADTSRVIDVYTYRVGIELGRFSYGTAVGLFKSVTSLSLLVIANFASRKVTGDSIY